jgi:hypothetical protein
VYFVHAVIFLNKTEIHLHLEYVLLCPVFFVCQAMQQLMTEVQTHHCLKLLVYRNWRVCDDCMANDLNELIYEVCHIHVTSDGA